MICRSGSQIRLMIDHCAYSGRLPTIGVQALHHLETAWWNSASPALR
jgi:hypothetical protein